MLLCFSRTHKRTRNKQIPKKPIQRLSGVHFRPTGQQKGHSLQANFNQGGGTTIPAAVREWRRTVIVSSSSSSSSTFPAPQILFIVTIAMKEREEESHQPFLSLSLFPPPPPSFRRVQTWPFDSSFYGGIYYASFKARWFRKPLSTPSLFLKIDLL